MSNLTHAPGEIRRLVEWLHEHEFQTLHDVPGGNFNQYLVLGNANARVAIRADRGDWDITISVDAGRTFWQADHLEAYLEGVTWIGATSSVGHRALFVQTRLAELEQRIHRDPDANAALHRIGDEWMSWRFGIPIPADGFPREAGSAAPPPHRTYDR